MKNHDSYREIILRLAKEKTDRRISNGQAEHATALFEAMFSTAEREVCIFTRALEPRVFDDPAVLAALWLFIQGKNRTLSVLIQDPDAASERVLTALAKCGVAKFAIRAAAGSYAQADARHFAVMDGRAFRFEFDHEKCSAIANFNEPGTAKVLNNTFHQAFGMGKRVRGFSDCHSLT